MALQKQASFLPFSPLHRRGQGQGASTQFHAEALNSQRDAGPLLGALNGILDSYLDELVRLLFCTLTGRQRRDDVFVNTVYFGDNDQVGTGDEVRNWHPKLDKRRRGRDRCQDQAEETPTDVKTPHAHTPFRSSTFSPRSSFLFSASQTETASRDLRTQLSAFLAL